MLSVDEVGPQQDPKSQSTSHITFVEIDHEIIFTAILSIQQIQEGKMSGTGESMCTWYWLTT